jgi:hypothetical protein
MGHAGVPVEEQWLGRMGYREVKPLVQGNAKGELITLFDLDLFDGSVVTIERCENPSKNFESIAQASVQQTSNLIEVAFCCCCCCCCCC